MRQMALIAYGCACTLAACVSCTPKCSDLCTCIDIACKYDIDTFLTSNMRPLGVHRENLVYFVKICVYVHEFGIL